MKIFRRTIFRRHIFQTCFGENLFGEICCAENLFADFVFAEDVPELAKILGADIEPLIPESYIKSAMNLGVNPPWCYYIGKEKYLSMVDSYTKTYFDFLSNQDMDKVSMHAKINSFLKKMHPCKYDISRIGPELDKHLKKSILPYLNEDSVAPPCYVRTKTKTGRLSVTSGPNVLTMHSALRKGVIDGYSIDFISMEPNFLLCSQGRGTKTDLYENIRKEVFENKISRAKVKIATMAALYGSTRTDKFAKRISGYFNIDEQVKNLENMVIDDTIKNKYDRVISLQGARGRHLLALWLQSSAADAALLGFYNFYRDTGFG